MERLVYTLLLVGVTAVWGWTFVVVRDAVAVYSVLGFLALRFAVASAALLGFAGFRISRRELAVGGAIGLVLAAAYLLQTLGLRFTTPTNSGIITGLFVVFAPIADRVLFGVRPGRQVLIAVVLSVAGIALVAGESPEEVRVGDILTVLCALAFGTHIALLSRYSRYHDTTNLAFAQILSMTLVFLFLWPFFEPVEPPPAGVWLAIILTGLVASALAFYIQTLVQRRLPAAQTAVILTMEPVFAALFGYWLAGDRLTPVQLAGATLILSALLIGEVLPALRRTRKKSRGAVPGDRPSS
ncbi:DMT family transporter [Rubrobacter taiwanensis]|uniref:DMT family transporter n=1 Tax=Rubrobacter taiwanensis TaxID=185139 RepID=A0A4R1BQS3_9ACTN|nr:DMT family transporter [Rubrobacter taiwanensis]TCJ20050.1 DMT family transporter [Rubrobacter taiwanensis]